MEYLHVGNSVIDYRTIGKKQLTSILNSNISKKALSYLLEMRKSKGKEIKYESIQMAQYLKPNNLGLTISEKKEMFAYRNKMNKISWNYKSKQGNNMCLTKCGIIETNEHIYNCEIFNRNINIIHKYENIYNGNLQTQVEIFRILKGNMEKRQILKENMEKRQIFPSDPNIS